jgi:hypothetical protein
MSSVPKLHHYLPEAYLRGFADESGTVSVFDRKGRADLDGSSRVEASADPSGEGAEWA